MMERFSADAAIGRVPLIWRGLAAILLLCGLLLAMVETHARVLRSETQVRLRTAPVDPRDLFRGDYVVLAYEISTVELSDAKETAEIRRGTPIFVRVKPGIDGFAAVVGASLARPQGAAGEIVLAGRVSQTVSCRRQQDGAFRCDREAMALRVAYGIEQYFVPQGSGKAIERTERERIEVVAAVSSSGQAAIKRLLIDGKLVHQEPPY
jgi:uncharacterized membrane-anchored protein